ncbi:MAG: hypothetical protein KBS91_02305 [Firmicutes bacterium]|nr:hypothetical protein [Candidatus Caballimonas caccae]
MQRYDINEDVVYDMTVKSKRKYQNRRHYIINFTKKILEDCTNLPVASYTDIISSENMDKWYHDLTLKMGFTHIRTQAIKRPIWVQWWCYHCKKSYYIYGEQFFDDGEKITLYVHKCPTCQRNCTRARYLPDNFKGE